MMNKEVKAMVTESGYMMVVKRGIKTISRQNNNVAGTCADIIAGGFSDEIIPDLVSELKVAFWAEEYTLKDRYHNDVLLDLSHVTVASDIRTRIVIPVIDINALCRIIYCFFTNESSIQTELVVDGGMQERKLSALMAKNRKRSASDVKQVKEFLAYIMTMKNKSGKTILSPEVFEEFRLFVSHLCMVITEKDGTQRTRKINEIAEVMGISESRAYWLRKKTAEYYDKYRHLDTKTVTFVPVDCYIREGYANQVEERITAVHDDIIIKKECKVVDQYREDTFYKRVDVNDNAKLTVGGKTYRTTAYTTPVYTELIPTANHDEKKVTFKEVSHGGEIVIKPENKRVRKYVIRMDSKSYKSINGCSYYKSDVTIAGSYQFCYGDFLVGYESFDSSHRLIKNPEYKEGSNTPKYVYSPWYESYLAYWEVANAMQKAFKATVTAMKRAKLDKEVADAESKIESSGKLIYKKENGKYNVYKNGTLIASYNLVKSK